ncbi:MAG: hypothetical protein PHS44_08365 [Candidatus Dojkabacteria bacterium]|nr:hypothetical protein [Candidatus Dojkabacteria bacterium]
MDNSKDEMLKRFAEMSESELDNFPLEELEEDWQKEIYVNRAIKLGRKYFAGLLLPPGEPAETKRYGSFMASYRKSPDGKWQLFVGTGMIPGYYAVLPRFLTYEKFVEEAKKVGITDEMCAKLKSEESGFLT